jgi:DNA-directed RNA polymerase subunit beta'
MVGYDSFDYDFGQGSGAAVPLEEFDLGDYR